MSNVFPDSTVLEHGETAHADTWRSNLSLPTVKQHSLFWTAQTLQKGIIAGQAALNMQFYMLLLFHKMKSTKTGDQAKRGGRVVLLPQ